MKGLHMSYILIGIPHLHSLSKTHSLIPNPELQIIALKLEMNKSAHSLINNYKPTAAKKLHLDIPREHGGGHDFFWKHFNAHLQIADEEQVVHEFFLGSYLFNASKEFETHHKYDAKLSLQENIDSHFNYHNIQDISFLSLINLKEKMAYNPNIEESYLHSLSKELIHHYGIL